MSIPTREQIADAAALIAPHVRLTPVLRVDLPDIGPVTLKLEMLQCTGSFKPRGAFLNTLRQRHRPATLVAASGGNHGLAVAYVGRRLGIPTVIYAPTTAPAAKISRLRSLGAQIEQHGDTYAEAYDASLEHAVAPGVLAVHAYDGPLTVTGQATLAREIEEQVPDVARVVAAVGGGGLMGGVAAWFGRSAELFGVEPPGSTTFAQAHAAGEPVDISPHGLASDALGASRIGDLPFAAMTAAGVRPVVVGEAAVHRARELLWRECRIACEPGGAVALAAVLEKQVGTEPPGSTVVVVCGANASPADLPMN